MRDEEALTIPVCHADGTTIGELRPITLSSLANERLVAACTKWRATYGRFFLTQFTPTPDRTRAWLRSIIADDQRMLFTIHSDGLLLGHYGFRDLGTDSAELDNLLRGERGGHPALMHSVVPCMANWLFATTGIQTVFGNILADNPMALKIHLDAGFQLAERRPLMLVEDDSGKRWEVGTAGQDSPHNKYYQTVTLRSGGATGRRGAASLHR